MTEMKRKAADTTTWIIGFMPQAITTIEKKDGLLLDA